MELTKEFAEAIVNDLIADDGEVAECLSCFSFGDFPGNIKHTSTCIVPKARLYLQEFKDGD